MHNVFIFGDCEICDGKQTEIHWLIRNRNVAHYHKRACYGCGLKMLKTDGIFVEEVPYVNGRSG